VLVAGGSMGLHYYTDELDDELSRFVRAVERARGVSE
jgi:hypothetical protein